MILNKEMIIRTWWERQLSMNVNKTYPGGQLRGPVVIYSSLVMCWPIVSWNPTLAIPKISGAKSARFDICPIRVCQSPQSRSMWPGAGIQDTETGWWLQPVACKGCQRLGHISHSPGTGWRLTASHLSTHLPHDYHSTKISLPHLTKY